MVWAERTWNQFEGMVGQGSTVWTAVPHKWKQGISPGPDSVASPQLKDGVGTPEDEAHRPSFKPQSLEEGVATQFSILAWRLPWTEEPGGI